MNYRTLNVRFQTIRQLIESRAPGKPPPTRRGRQPGSEPDKVLAFLRRNGGGTLTEVARYLHRGRAYAELVLSEMVRAGTCRLDGETYKANGG